MIDYHRNTGAALTIAYKAIDLENVKLFGMVEVDENNNLMTFVEKPDNPSINTIFTAVCIFQCKKLAEYLEKLQKSHCWKYDISKDVIPAMIKGGEVIKCFHFKNHWEDRGH